MAAETLSGTCFCGAVTFAVTGPPLEAGYRAYSGNPVSAYQLWRSADVTVTNGAEHLGGFNKSGMSERQYCTRCGGHLMTVHPTLGLTDVRPGAIPAVAFAPTVHLNYAETVLPMKDGLTKLKDFPAEAGGSGETVAE